MDRTQLAFAWEAVRELPFPSAPQDENLADWLFDMLEADGFYAGIAISVLAGERPSLLPRAHELAELADRLGHLQVAPPDEKILEQCRTYFWALQRLHKALLS